MFFKSAGGNRRCSRVYRVALGTFGQRIPHGAGMAAVEAAGHQALVPQQLAVEPAQRHTQIRTVHEPLGKARQARHLPYGGGPAKPSSRNFTRLGPSRPMWSHTEDEPGPPLKEKVSGRFEASATPLRV